MSLAARTAELKRYAVPDEPYFFFFFFASNFAFFLFNKDWYSVFVCRCKSFDTVFVCRCKSFGILSSFAVVSRK